MSSKVKEDDESDDSPPLPTSPPKLRPVLLSHLPSREFDSSKKKKKEEDSDNGETHSVYAFDVFEEKATLHSTHDSEIRLICVHPSGDWYYTINDGGYLYEVEVSSGNKSLQLVSSALSNAQVMTFHDNAIYFASGRKDGRTGDGGLYVIHFPTPKVPKKMCEYCVRSGRLLRNSLFKGKKNILCESCGASKREKKPKKKSAWEWAKKKRKTKTSAAATVTKGKKKDISGKTPPQKLPASAETKLSAPGVSWSNATVMTSIDSRLVTKASPDSFRRLFIVCGRMGRCSGGGGLYSINPTDGTYHRLNAKANWGNATLIASDNVLREVYIVCGKTFDGCDGGGGLYRVSTKDGSYTQLISGCHFADGLISIPNNGRDPSDLWVRKQKGLKAHRHYDSKTDTSSTIMRFHVHDAAKGTSPSFAKCNIGLLQSVRRSRMTAGPNGIFYGYVHVPGSDLPILARQKVVAKLGLKLFSDSIQKLPRDWTPMASKQTNDTMVVLDAVSRDRDIDHAIRRQVSRYLPNSSITQIRRVQNKHLWQAYTSRLCQMISKNGETGVNEKWLWAVASPVYPSPCFSGTTRGGFDPRIEVGARGFVQYVQQQSGTGRALYVHGGVLFTADPASTGHKFTRQVSLVYVRVLCGITKTVRSTEDLPRPLKRPPPLPSGHKAGPGLYDSLQSEDETRVLVFKKDMAYPAYVVDLLPSVALKAAPKVAFAKSVDNGCSSLFGDSSW